jgi:hypothetical protein
MIGVLHEHVDQGRHGGLWPVVEDEKLKVWLMPYRNKVWLRPYRATLAPPLMTVGRH